METFSRPGRWQKAKQITTFDSWKRILLAAIAFLVVAGLLYLNNSARQYSGAAFSLAGAVAAAILVPGLYLLTNAIRAPRLIAEDEALFYLEQCRSFEQSTKTANQKLDSLRSSLASADRWQQLGSEFRGLHPAVRCFWESGTYYVSSDRVPEIESIARKAGAFLPHSLAFNTLYPAASEKDPLALFIKAIVLLHPEQVSGSGEKDYLGFPEAGSIETFTIASRLVCLELAAREIELLSH